MTDDELTGKDINEIHSALSYWGDKRLHDLFDDKFIHKVRVREAAQEQYSQGHCTSPECTGNDNLICVGELLKALGIEDKE